MSNINILRIVLCCLFVLVCIPTASSESLAESDHPYANNFEDTWIISEPGAAQIRLHFEYLKLGEPGKFSSNFQVYDKLILYDKYDNVLQTYGTNMGFNDQNFWTEWYTGDTLKVKLVTDSSGTANGFIIDKTETRMDTSTSKGSLDESNSLIESNPVAESDHPYANNYKNTWTISEPGAAQIRLHFEYLKLGEPGKFSSNFQVYDKLILYDKYDNVLQTYGTNMGFNDQNFWTEWYTGDTLKVKLVTDSSGTANGFKIDKTDTRMDKAKEPKKDENNILTITDLTSLSSSMTLGQSVTFIAEVEIPSHETEKPFGTVTFKDGTTTIGIADVSSGQATLTTSSLSVGSHSITAEYSGDSNFKSSTSAPFTLTVKEQSSIEEPSSYEKSSNNEESSNPEEQNNIEEPASNEEMSSTKQNSPITDFIVALASGFILLVVGSIVQNKKNKK